MTSSQYKLQQSQHVKYLTFPIFNMFPRVVNAFSTRIGGISSGPFATLNLAFPLGDDPQNILTNRKLFCQSIGVNYQEVVCAQQVHEDTIAAVDEKNKGQGAYDFETGLPATDGLMTATTGVPIMTFYADCVPLFFLDPSNRVIALSHAGWKGTVARIGAKTIAAMQEEYGSRPQDIRAVIGPSIGPCCYEVDVVVRDKIERAIGQSKRLLKAKPNDRWDLDLWATNRLILEEAGLLPAHISVSGLCTKCRRDLFYSHRRDGKETGRMAAVLMLK